jgi:hypothetical protein
MPFLTLVLVGLAAPSCSERASASSGAKIFANERDARQTLEDLHVAQEQLYLESNPQAFAPSLAQLYEGNSSGGSGYIDEATASGRKNGYALVLKASCGDGAEPTCTPSRWQASAHPLVYGRTGNRSFFIDESGILRGDDADGGLGHSQMPEL